MEEIINKAIYQFSYLELYLYTFLYFMVLYFLVGPLLLYACKFLSKKGYLNKIVDRPVKQSQINFEIKHSFKSIILFGFSSLPIIYLIRSGTIELAENSVSNIIIGIVILNIWNEVHFFIVHRIMHIPFFMKNVHYIHHKSRTPTVYSVYCFHWFEALLLSTVPFIIALFIAFAPLAIALYPLSSILLNFSGHCNYRFGNGKGSNWTLFGTHHNQHHSKGKQNFGFASDLLDQLYALIKK